MNKLEFIKCEKRDRCRDLMEVVLINGVYYFVFIKEFFDWNFKLKRMKDKNLYCINLGNIKWF